MSLMEKAQTFFGKLAKPAGQGSDPSYTQRADGSMSGYHPNATQRVKPVQTAAPQAPEQTPVPEWTPEPGYVPPQQMGQQTPDGKPAWLQSSRQQPVSAPMQPEWAAQPQQGYTQQMNYNPQPQQPFQPQWQQPVQPQDYQGGFAPTWQQPVANAPGSPYEGYVGGQPGMQMGQQPMSQQPQAAPDNIVYMNGVTVGQDGTAYRHSMRVAQITTVPDCYRLVAFMRSGESVLVNLDEMRETEEMGRCLDLLYGAAYALQCTFTRVATRSLYLITPADILVQPYNSIAEASDREIDARWPDPASLGFMQRTAAREQQRYGRFTQQQTYVQPQHNAFGAVQGYQPPSGGFTQQQYAASGDPMSFGNRAANRSQNTGYTDFGGFGSLGGRR